VYHQLGDRTKGDFCPTTLLAKNVPARILGIDFGLKRIGLAVSDPLGLTAQGLPTLARVRREEDLRQIEKLVEEFSAERVVVSNPISQSGKENAMSCLAAEFARKLRERLPCPVELWDERLTSAEAERVLRASGIGIEKRRRARDRVAATLLLQSYLDYRANESRRSQDAGANR